MKKTSKSSPISNKAILEMTKQELCQELEYLRAGESGAKKVARMGAH